MSTTDPLRDAASRLMHHVTTDLEEATDREVSRLPYDALRRAAAQYLMQNAKQQWRTAQLERERHAVIQKVQTPAYKAKEAARWAEQDARNEERASKVRDDLNQAMRDYERSIKVKWARELLDAGFALPDGTLTTWGDATVDQHQQRIEMLQHQARTSTEAAARHLKAVNTISEAGAATLRDAVKALESAGAPS